MKKIYLQKIIKEETNKFLLKKFIKENRHLKTEKQLDEAFARFTHLLNESYTIEEGLFDSFNKTKEAAKAIWNKLKGTLKGIGLGALMSFVVSSGLSAQDIQKMNPIDLQNKVENFTEVNSDKSVTTNKYDINKTEYGALAVEPKIATDKASEFKEKISPKFTRDVTKFINQIASIDKNGYPRYKLGSKMEVRLSTIINAAREAMLKRDVTEDSIIVNVPQYGKFKAYNIGDKGVVLVDGLEYLVTQSKYDMPELPSKKLKITGNLPTKMGNPDIDTIPFPEYKALIPIRIQGSHTGYYDINNKVFIFKVTEGTRTGMPLTQKERQEVKNIAKKYGFQLKENGLLNSNIIYVYDIQNNNIEPFTEGSAESYGFRPHEAKQVMKAIGIDKLEVLRGDLKVLNWGIRDFERYFKNQKGIFKNKIKEFSDSKYGIGNTEVQDIQKDAWRKMEKDLEFGKMRAKELAKQRREIEKAKLRQQRGLD